MFRRVGFVHHSSQVIVENHGNWVYVEVYRDRCPDFVAGDL